MWLWAFTFTPLLSVQRSHFNSAFMKNSTDVNLMTACHPTSRGYLMTSCWKCSTWCFCTRFQSMQEAWKAEWSLFHGCSQLMCDCNLAFWSLLQIHSYIFIHVFCLLLDLQWDDPWPAESILRILRPKRRFQGSYSGCWNHRGIHHQCSRGESVYLSKHYTTHLFQSKHSQDQK